MSEERHGCLLVHTDAVFGVRGWRGIEMGALGWVNTKDPGVAVCVRWGFG